MVNEKLLAARKARHWSIEVASARIGVSRVTYSRWENGHQEPQPGVLALLCQAFGMSADELGYEHLSKEPLSSETNERNEQATAGNQGLICQLPDDQVTAFASLLRLGESIMFDPAKRETLQTLLAAVSIAMTRPQGILQPHVWQQLLSSETDLAKTNEATLQGFEKLIDACWQLSRGNELALAEELLPTCMTRLIPLAQHPSKYQQAAANLAAQGFRLYSILALHRNDLLARELYCKQAVQYSQLSGDQNLLIASLKGLADTYYYGNQYPQALETYLNAFQHAKGVSPLLQARVHMGLAVAYAHIDQKQEAFTSLGLAVDTFPDFPETDPCFSYADFDLSQMILWEGLTRSQLGQPQKALAIFERIEQADMMAPERIRIEIANQRAKTALLLGDMEQGAAYIETGVMGARTLGSQRRLNEAYENFRQMCKLWPSEKRVKELGELFQQTA
jgi:transcriptional regulator with XRE-family HTH domain